MYSEFLPVHVVDLDLGYRYKHIIIIYKSKTLFLHRNFLHVGITRYHREQTIAANVSSLTSSFVRKSLSSSLTFRWHRLLGLLPSC